MARIVYMDRVRLGRQTNCPPRLAIIRENEMHWQDFASMYGEFYDEDTLKELIPFCQAIIRQRRSYDESNKTKIIGIIQPDSEYFKEMRNLILFGYSKLAPHQIQAFVTLICGYQTMEQLTKTNVLKNSQYILDITDTNNPHIGIKDIPKFIVPISFVFTIQKFVGHRIIKELQEIIDPGFHTFEAFLASMQSYFEFSCIYYIYMHIYIYIII